MKAMKAENIEMTKTQIHRIKPDTIDAEQIMYSHYKVEIKEKYELSTVKLDFIIFLVKAILKNIFVCRLPTDSIKSLPVVIFLTRHFTKYFYLA